LKTLFSFIFVVVVGALISLYTFGQIVPAGYIGVRQTLYGPGKGFSNKGLRPGLHWSVPLYSMVHVVPETLQTISFDKRPGSRTSGGALDVKTGDGAVVDLNVTVITKIYDSKTEDHGGPADLITGLSLDQSRWAEQVRTVANGELRKSLSQLMASTFYEPEERARLTSEAEKAMRVQLAPYGISVREILLRRYTYRSERIDNAIFQKNLQDQEERLNEASSALSKAKAKLERVAAEWDAKIETLRVEGENKGLVIRSEADLVAAQKRSEANLAVAQATAEVQQLKAAALASSVGADVFVARELTPLLRSLSGGILSDIDPFDLDKWVEKFGVKR
jgi:regulator of protease activity HflC (stomatin/prohibitin superfamily)